MNEPLWRPDPKTLTETNVIKFISALNERFQLTLTDTQSLWEFSVNEPEKFWSFLRDFAGIIGEGWGERVLINGDKLPGAIWFPDAKLNFTENLLRQATPDPAIIFRAEEKVSKEVSYKELHDQISQLAAAMKGCGVRSGDVVAGCMPNMPESLIAMMAATSLGAIWSSCSPDFGVQGVIDRFGQIKPKILFAVDGYYYNGKEFNIIKKLEEITTALPTLKKVILTPFIGKIVNLSKIPNAETIAEFTSGHPPGQLVFERFPFNHPLYILFSSGTTGKPKCIVHSAGGTLIKHASEQLLHCDIKPKERVFYFTTCGWMMWNWLVTNLAWGATLLLYDGSPTYPSYSTLFDFVDDTKMTFFGTSAKFIDSLAKAKEMPKKTHDLSSLKTIASTGSPLAPESFDYVYRHIKSSVHLASISGGTDIVGTFCAGDPTKPVWRGEIQIRTFGMATDVFDDTGKPVREQKGELVCTQPFPTVPLGFLNDPDNSKFHDAYFNIFPGIWTHGDYVELTKNNGFIIYGRSDATLNPGGVRIGTAEIYRQVEKLEEVQESIVIGQDWNSDTRIVLFVVLKSEISLTKKLIEKIKKEIRENCTPRHVPEKILSVNDIPRTKSGKITELAVRDIVHGRKIKNKEALANPEALEQFKGRLELFE